MQSHNHANHQHHRPEFNPRRTSNTTPLRTHGDTAASLRLEPECPLCGFKSAQLEVGITVGHFLVEAYVERPQHGPLPQKLFTSRRLACAMKPADHHRTPHQDGRLFDAKQKKTTPHCGLLAGLPFYVVGLGA